MKYTINNFKSRSLAGKFLLTTDHGSWIFLSKEDLGKLKIGKIEEEDKLFKTLEDKGIILTDNNIEEVEKRLAKKYEFLFQGTSLHIVVATLRCNMKCVYCHASSKDPNLKGFDMGKETAKKTVDFIFQSPSSKITIEFQGGEPFLNWDVVKYTIDYANETNKKCKKELNFTIVSNLTLLDEEKIEFVTKNNIGICTSLDGPQEVHDKNRTFFGGGGTHAVTTKSVAILNKGYDSNLPGRRAHALTTITKHALGKPKEVVDEFIKNGFNVIPLRPLHNLGYARETWEQISYPPEDFILFWTKAMDYILELNKKGKFVRERTSVILLKKMLTNTDPNYLDLRSPCGAAIGQLLYNYDGKIYTCDEARTLGEDIFIIGDVKKNTYGEVLKSETTCAIVTASTNDSFICSACVYKPYCGLCPVCSYAKTGSLIENVSESDRCKIFKAQFDYLFRKINDAEYEGVLKGWIKEGI